uniref:Uncharacterized protein n=1 Tax=Romanomermis culicivorax TaxID=13658 RepID=A0A915KJL4_ROMCU
HNVKRVVRIHELDQWFKGTFGYWPANPKEPVLLDIWKARHPVCRFNVKKIGQDKVAALFKTTEVDNPSGKQFACYISFALSNVHYRYHRPHGEGMAIHYIMADYLLMQMQVFGHDRMEPEQINAIALHFYQQ